MSRDETADSSETEAPRKRGGLLRWLTIIFLVVFVAVFLSIGLAAGSFLRFAKEVVAMAPPDEAPTADGIVVLTGGSQRIDQAVRLLDDGNAERLLITGVHPTTTGEHLRKLTSAEPKLFECCVDIGHDALDTRGNASEAANWISRNGYDTIIVVTSNYHMPRSMVELARINTDTRFIPYPVVNRDYGDPEWLGDPAVLRMLIQEYAKLIFARLRHQLGQPGSDGLRSSQSPPAVQANAAGGN